MIGYGEHLLKFLYMRLEQFGSNILAWLVVGCPIQRVWGSSTI